LSRKIDQRVKWFRISTRFVTESNTSSNAFDLRVEFPHVPVTSLDGVCGVVPKGDLAPDLATPPTDRPLRKVFAHQILLPLTQRCQIHEV
jgi:hypothetical protein